MWYKTFEHGMFGQCVFISNEGLNTNKTWFGDSFQIISYVENDIQTFNHDIICFHI